MERKIKLGGDVQLPADANGIIDLIASHDESCFKAGEQQTGAWCPNKRQQCQDKSDGPSVHFACFAVEYGNGCICMHPDDDVPPYPVSLKELRAWYAADIAGEDVALLRTADVWMEPGYAVGKEGYWKSQEFWMQTRLACKIFKATMGPKFRLVAVLDWSQGHAAKAPSSLDASALRLSDGCATQPHMQSTIYPVTKVRGRAIKREFPCTPGCQECVEERAAKSKLAGFKAAEFQCIGKKGARQICIERGIYREGWNLEHCVNALAKHDDFTPRSAVDKAYVTELMGSFGYVALFGVKYHAECAWIERKWMRLKELVLPHLDGTLPKLHKLLKKHWKKFAISDAWKAARHCRETIRAYRILGNDVEMDGLEAARKVQKSHRKAIDSADGLLKEMAQLSLKEKEKRAAAKTLKRRENTAMKDKFFATHEAEFEAYKRRMARYYGDDEKRAAKNHEHKLKMRDIRDNKAVVDDPFDWWV